MEILLEILEWVKKCSAPNENYKYSRCTICGHAWWDDQEKHNFDCWVPRLKKAVEQGLRPTNETLIEELKKKIAYLENENIVMYSALFESSNLGGVAGLRCKVELQRIARNDTVHINQPTPPSISIT